MNASVETDVYMDEYTREDIIAKYISDTAGTGIAHILKHVYAPIYLKAIRETAALRPRNHAFTVMEYGCGGGMNLVRIMELLRSEGLRIKAAYGVDFSPPMVEAARVDVSKHLPKELIDTLHFGVAANQTLIADLCRSFGKTKADLVGTFDLIVGVNTTRYAHRNRGEFDLAKDILDLLAPGGQTVMIDMNRHFPFFKSRLKSVFAKESDETYIPTLREYVKPFREVGFNVTDCRNFCWIPHSASKKVLAMGKTAAPVLDVLCPSLAMRSLVVGQKTR